jgi:hypothetical protein
MQSALDQEMSWRIKEIGVFQVSAGSVDARRKPMIRAGVALLYAHWEGFIKNASEIYLEFVESRGLSYRSLKPCFVVFGLKGRITSLVESRKSNTSIEAIEFILNKMDDKSQLGLKSAINTESNLSSTVFSNIAGSLDIDTTRYQTKFNLIDSSLLDRRNKVAHGEYLDIAGSDFADLASEILLLMRWYKTDIENAASLGSYRRPVA